MSSPSRKRLQGSFPYRQIPQGNPTPEPPQQQQPRRQLHHQSASQQVSQQSLAQHQNFTTFRPDAFPQPTPQQSLSQSSHQISPREPQESFPSQYFVGRTFTSAQQPQQGSAPHQQHLVTPPPPPPQQQQQYPPHQNFYYPQALATANNWQQYGQQSGQYQPDNSGFVTTGVYYEQPPISLPDSTGIFVDHQPLLADYHAGVYASNSFNGPITIDSALASHSAMDFIGLSQAPAASPLLPFAENSFVNPQFLYPSNDTNAPLPLLQVPDNQIEERAVSTEPPTPLAQNHIDSEETYRHCTFRTNPESGKKAYKCKWGGDCALFFSRKVDFARHCAEVHLLRSRFICNDDPVVFAEIGHEGSGCKRVMGGCGRGFKRKEHYKKHLQCKRKEDKLSGRRRSQKPPPDQDMGGSSSRTTLDQPARPHIPGGCQSSSGAAEKGAYGAQGGQSSRGTKRCADEDISMLKKISRSFTALSLTGYCSSSSKKSLSPKSQCKKVKRS
ncbi:hypothetical protein BJ508DRAFT_66038 [Ascobolus immersus RN42]|uniref:Uncharacterized protein n=1 Tax=Ascobolus immersus RN42 TaxID=1160509 RepID=A0A3N4IBJ1_ASCIM|nr:hypothetical protein BJ508DRAFT_66038 [Ascobolus immersus RN42]